jgi:mycothiol synthase
LFERAMYRAREIDTNNPTPALGVYLSVGMNPTLVMDGLRCVLPTG